MLLLVLRSQVLKVRLQRVSAKLREDAEGSCVLWLSVGIQDSSRLLPPSEQAVSAKAAPAINAISDWVLLRIMSSFGRRAHQPGGFLYGSGSHARRWDVLHGDGLKG